MKKEVSTMEEKILIIEDDIDLHFILCKMLRKHNYIIQSAYSGREAEQLIQQNHYDLILLDLMLPEVTGEELIKIIRKEHTVPIMIISAKTHIEDRVSALENGADDYLMKPFEQQEVLARVGALIRRYKQFSHQQEENILTFHQMKLDIVAHECSVNGQKLSLTSKEFELLRLFLQNPQKVFTKEQLYQKIWGNDYIIEDNSINVHISNLRKKIKEFDMEKEYIETVWGIGFKLKST